MSVLMLLMLLMLRPTAGRMNAPVKPPSLATGPQAPLPPPPKRAAGSLVGC